MPRAPLTYLDELAPVAGHKRFVRIGVVAALLSALLLCIAPGARTETNPRLKTQLHHLVAAGSPGAILLVRRGSRTISFADGLADTDRKTPISANATFRIGSLTKTQVAVVVLQLVEEGKLSLDDSVSSRLPGLVPTGDRITLRQLLNHTSGIPDFDHDKRVLAPYLSGNLGYAWAPRQLVRIAVTHKPQFAPGAKYSYSNTNYLVLGLIVEAVTGKPLATELSERIYRPLGLDQTRLQSSTSAGSPQVHGYYIFGAPPAADITALSPYPWASGAVVSNASDLGAFYRALLGGRLLAPALLGEMLTTVGEAARTDFPGQRYGLGIERYATPCGIAWGHGGNFPGYLAYAFTSADGHRQAELVLNQDPSSLPDRVGQMYTHLLIDAYCSAGP